MAEFQGHSMAVPGNSESVDSPARIGLGTVNYADDGNAYIYLSGATGTVADAVGTYSAAFGFVRGGGPESGPMVQANAAVDASTKFGWFKILQHGGLGRKAFIETLISEAAQDGAGTYDVAFPIPAGAWVTNIYVKAVAVWNDGSGAVLDVGDTDDDDGYFDAIDVKATDLTAGQTLDFNRTGGKGGLLITEGSSTHTLRMFYPAAKDITARVTVTDADGTLGRTRVGVEYVLPAAGPAAAFTAT